MIREIGRQFKLIHLAFIGQSPRPPSKTELRRITHGVAARRLPASDAFWQPRALERVLKILEGAA
jgi:hypothetical protein